MRGTRGEREKLIARPVKRESSERRRLSRRVLIYFDIGRAREQQQLVYERTRGESLSVCICGGEVR